MGTFHREAAPGDVRTCVAMVRTCLEGERGAKNASPGLAGRKQQI
jgi:hypothetical protein